jgi:hypothetical protein
MFDAFPSDMLAYELRHELSSNSQFFEEFCPPSLMDHLIAAEVFL